MLDCQASANNNNNQHKKDGDNKIHCKYCQETAGDTLGSSPTVYWGIQLDQDLLETIISVYPEWFKDYNLNLSSSSSSNMAEQQPPPPPPPPPHPSSSSSGGNSSGSSSSRHHLIPCRSSPPKAEVDETPIQKTMDKNKESLKVKLMLRRPIAQLVDQGIMPPLKTPPAFHEQRQKLERAKMGDLLKSKIQRRPDRQELIQQHILEDSNVDPSLQDRQRQLKKARLADDLNDRLSHRPGPLELIKGNILKTDEQFAQAVREGQISFKKTSDGEIRKHPPPMFVFEEDSSSEGALSPLQDSDQSQVGSVQSTTNAEGCVGVPVPVASPSLVSSITSSLSPLSSVSSPSSITLSPGALPPMMPSVTSPMAKMSPCVPAARSETRDQSRSRKKSKSKSQPKTRTIKFHEYKGPPNAQKNQQTSTMPVESSYDLLLQQQQLFLQWQLEWQHKYPQIILPASQKSGDSAIGQPQLSSLVGAVVANNVMPTAIGAAAAQGSVLQQDGGMSSPNRCLSKLEDMKVSDLKAELKKRNLPVSGSKPQLIERLKPYADAANSAASSSSTSAAVRAVTPAAMLDSGSQGMMPGGEESLSNAPNMDTPMSPEVNNNMTPDSSQDGSTTGMVSTTFKAEPVGVAAFEPQSSPPRATLIRPPSVAPMDVDNGGFDAMDVTDAANHNHQPMSLYQTTSAGSPHNTVVPSPVSATGDELLKIKIEELERELQRECEGWQNQQGGNNDYRFYDSLRERPQHVQHQQQQPAVVQQQQAQPPIAKIVLSSQQAPPASAAATQTPADAKTQQRLILQQHLQQKIQQQQLQQQQQQQLQQQQQQQQQIQLHAPVRSVASNPLPNNANAKASLVAFLQGQSTALPANTSNNILGNSHPSTKPFLKSGGANTLLSGTGGQQPAQQQQPYFLNQVNLQKQRAGVLPNGITHQRTNSLPSFTPPAKNNVVVRTTTDPQFIITKPPPNYDEATKQLNKQQFAQGLLNNMVNPPSGHKSVKSQAVDDVLEILIKNGELPPSAAQDPATPTTPKSSLPSGIVFTTTAAPVSTTMVSSPLKMTSATMPPLMTVAAALPPPPPPLPPPPGNSGGVGMSLKLNTHAPVPHLGDVGLGSPDLDVNLDLDGLEAMDISQLTGDVGGLAPTSNVDLSDAMHMDIDVSDWLDSMMPPPSSLNTAAATTSSAVDSSDPLLCNSQDPFDLFNLDETDFKTPTDLSSLNWDKVDFAT